jgi:hypothetical protein
MNDYKIMREPERLLAAVVSCGPAVLIGILMIMSLLQTRPGWQDRAYRETQKAPHRSAGLKSFWALNRAPDLVSANAIDLSWAGTHRQAPYCELARIAKRPFSFWNSPYLAYHA